MTDDVSPTGREKRTKLHGGPLDGHMIAVPGLTAALIVFHGEDFHRYSIAASGGRVGTAVPLAYDAPVSPSVAGYRSTSRDHTGA
jgi:hypothetical protein